MINVELSFHVLLLSPRDPCPQNRGRHTGGCRHPVDALRQLVKGEQVCFANWIPIFIGMTSDSTSIILDPSVDGTNNTYDGTNATWSVTFPNYTISGIASCNSLSGTENKAYPEYNNQITQGETSGANCWCRMTSPVRSAWVFYYTSSSASDCAAFCANLCGADVRSDASFRGGIFGSAGN